MSRREQRRRGNPGRRVPIEPADIEAPPASRVPPAFRPPLSAATIPALALLPLRIFLGVTFLYAGLDKLLDPAFFDASAPTSIVAQVAAFARDSPLSPLIKVAEPYALLIGLPIAIAEIGIGLGALTGLAFRVAAVGGAALSILFWLTASWATHPYYYGPDLPYAAGWITLALAGHGGLLVSRRILAIGAAPPVTRRDRAGRPVERGGPPSPERRVLLQSGILAGISLVVASFALPVRLLGRSSGTPTASGGTGSGGTAGASSSPGSTATATRGPAASVPAGAIKVATVADVSRRGSVAFAVPASAPAPLPAGDPAVIVRLKDGTFVAYDAVCTHEGCTVEWDAADGVLLCPCHGAAFDAADHAAVLQGPTNTPLASLPIVVDAATGNIYLHA